MHESVTRPVPVGVLSSITQEQMSALGVTLGDIEQVLRILGPYIHGGQTLPVIVERFRLFYIHEAISKLAELVRILEDPAEGPRFRDDNVELLDQLRVALSADPDVLSKALVERDRASEHAGVLACLRMGGSKWVWCAPCEGEGCELCAWNGGEWSLQHIDGCPHAIAAPPATAAGEGGEA